MLTFWRRPGYIACRKMAYREIVAMRSCYARNTESGFKLMRCVSSCGSRIGKWGILSPEKTIGYAWVLGEGGRQWHRDNLTIRMVSQLIAVPLRAEGASEAPYLRKFGNPSIWKIWVVTWLPVRTYVCTSVRTPIPRKLKPWPNGVASTRKFSTCVYLRLRLARACVHLRWLAMTWAHFGRDQICKQVDASFSPFGHPTQVNASWVMSINLLLANKKRICLAWNGFFGDLHVLARKLASPFGHPTQVSTQAQLLATCDYLRVRLTRA